MSQFDNNDPLTYEWYDSAFSHSEQITVIGSKSYLTYIPDSFNGCVISGLSEIKTGTPTSGQFKVDYRNGRIEFHTDVTDNVNYTVGYYARGVIKTPAQRVDFADKNGIFNSDNLEDAMTETMAKVNTNETSNQSRMTQIEQDSISRDTNHENSTTAHDANSITYTGNVSGANVKEALDNTDIRIDNIVSQAGTDNTEIVDLRLGADGVARTVAGDLMREIHTQQLESNSQKKTLVHGLNLIESDTPSPMNVEFSGITRVNLPGREGGFHSQGKWGTNLTIDTSTYKFGTSSGKIDNSAGTANKTSTNTQKLYLNGKYVLLGFWAKAVSGTPSISGLLIERNADGTFKDSVTTNSITINNTWKFYHAKFDLTARTGDHWQTNLSVNTYGTANDVVNFDGLVVQELTSTRFNEIGVSLLDKDVERLFPYVDSVQHTRNVFAKVSGANLAVNAYGFGTLHSNVTVNKPYDITLNATGVSQSSAFNPTVIGNTQYTFSGSFNGKVRIFSRDKDGYNLVTHHDANVNSDNFSVVFTTHANAKDLNIIFTNDTSGTYTFKNWMLNLGDTAKPFTEKNDSYLYAETVLAGNSNKKDILRKNYSLDVPRWEKVKNYFIDFVLDGSLSGWGFLDNYTEYKRVYLQGLPSTPKAYGEGFATKYNRIPIHNRKDDSAIQKPDYFHLMDTNNEVVLYLANTDTGWLDSWTSSTHSASDWTNFIKSYFHGWAYNGDGTTHSWVSLVDGSAPSTNTLAYVSANMAPNFTPYELTYQLAKSTVEPVTVEGDLSISGDAIVEVGEGVIPREVANPVYYATSDVYYVNSNSTAFKDSILNYRANKIIKVYKNEVDVTELCSIYVSSNNYGKEAFTISGKDFNPSTDELKVTYELLDKYNFTTNIQEVTANYASSLKSSFQRTVEQVSDNTTAISILDRLKANKAQEQWINATLQNGWVNFGSTYESAEYFKDEFGIVHIKGFVKSGTTGTIFTLPKGYRPSKDIRTSSISSDGTTKTLSELTVTSGGDVILNLGSNSWLSIRLIPFIAEQ